MSDDFQEVGSPKSSIDCNLKRELEPIVPGLRYECAMCETRDGKSEDDGSLEPWESWTVSESVTEKIRANPTKRGSVCPAPL